MSGIPDTLTGLSVPIRDLVPYETNPRRGDVALLVRSLQVHGQYRPIVVRVGTNQVLAGNHTLAAATHLGWTSIAATFVNVTDEQAAQIVLLDNRANDLAGYDQRVLLELLEEVAAQAEDGLTASGYVETELIQLRQLLDGVEEDAAPDQFKAFDLDLDTDYRCPSCSYEWSGRPRPMPSSTELDDGLGDVEDDDPA